MTHNKLIKASAKPFMMSPHFDKVLSKVPTRLSKKVICLGAAIAFLFQGVGAPVWAADLRIGDGVVVKFGPNAQLVVRDRLTSGKGVTLTSLKDDTVSGQTGTLPQTPAAGDWGGLRLEKSSSAYGQTTFNDVSIRYGGSSVDGSAAAALTVRGRNPNLQFVELDRNAVGLRLLSGASPSISGSSFTNNAVGIEANDGSLPVISNSQFYGNSVLALDNKKPDSVVQATGNWWGHVSGPKELTANPQGQGDAVSSGVNFGNYLAAAPLLNPAIRLSAPSTFFDQSTVLLDISCINATEYRIAEGGAFAGVSFSPLMNGRGHVAFTTSTGDGKKAISVQFMNAAGTVATAILDGGVTVDTQAPSLALVTPTTGSSVSQPISIEASASDGSGIAQVEFYVDGVSIGKKTQSPYVVGWDPTSASVGSHVVKAIATDNAGKTAQQENDITVERSTTVPQVVSRALPNNNYIASSTGTGSPYAAFNDGNWSSGTYSGWIQVDLGTTYTVSKVSYAPGVLTKSGDTFESRIEQISVSETSSGLSTVYSETVTAKNGEQRSVVVAPVVARYIRITVPNSQSWVALSNIQITGLPYPLNATPDKDGPQLLNVTVGGSPLVNGAVLTKNTTIGFTASDKSGIARIELVFDGVVVGTLNGSGSSLPLKLDAIANGTHDVTLRALDSLGNSSTSTYSVSVAHAAPDTPALTSPANGFITRTAALTVIGNAQPGSSVSLFINDQPAGSATAGTDRRFSTSVTLAPGANRIQASAMDQYGTSPLSASVNVTLDTSVPESPTNLNATAQAAGKVRLSWTRSTDPNLTGYDVYRSASTFTTIGEATKITSSPIASNVYDDLPSQDGVWNYRVVAVNSVRTPSLPSNAVQVTSDGTAPKALSITYVSLGKTDPTSGRIGQGKVNVTLTTNESLQAVPYLSIVPQGGTPISVELAKTGDTTYTGAFLVDANTPSGIANALFSARDAVGNRGTDIGSGATLNIDTDGPALSNIVITPTSPIKNNTAQQIAASFTFSKAPSATPQVKYLLSGPVRTPVVIGTLNQVNPTTYQGSFVLPADAGLGSPETLTFSFQAKDDLDNVSTRVSAFNKFQVYQGNLPPSDVPFGFSAKAQPGGKVKLSWQAVDGASSYQLYRQGPGQASLQVLTRATGVDYIDQTPQDGAYKYAVASVRQSNDQESVSGQSAIVDVVASATAPGAPQNLALQLTGQGIYATWQPPLASTVDYYNLYRSTGTSITTIEGLTPYKTRIKNPVTYDTSPSPTQGAYVVTAVDSAGNESAISNSTYLNASLLPVRNLKAQQIGNDLPVISWTAPNGNVAGYLVYVGSGSSKVKLTPGLITSTSFTDTGYTSGERNYTVSSVDSQGVEISTSVLMPAVLTQVASGTPLKRGVMNKLQVQVANLSGGVMSSARVVVRLPINKDSSQFKDHKSEPFTLGGNQTQLVSVIVGGYADLPGSAQAQVGIELVPNEGQLVKIARNQAIDVVDGALVVGMATDEFTRGGTGKLKLTIENTSEVDTELLTATGNGAADSTELRFKILDADGNVLATQPYKQVFGANVVTLTNGQTVARIPAGTSYVSDVFNLNVPASSPNSIRVKLEVDKLRYHTGQEDEVSIAGRGSERTVSLIDTAYAGEVTDVNPISSFGDQDVVITGRAFDRQSGGALPNSRLKLVLNQQGFERIINVITDATGQFVYSFKPTITDAGLYKVSAVHPDITDRPEQKAFTINRVTVGPSPYKLDVPKNYPFSIPFTAKAGVGTQAKNLRLSLNAASQPTGQLPVGVSLQLPAPVTLAERQTMNVPVLFTANNEALSSGAFILDVISDEHPLSPIGQVRVDYKLSEAKPFLVSTPSFVETGLVQGGSQIESVVVKNNGLQDALNLQFSLTKADGTPAQSWASIASSANGTLAVGGARTIDLSFTPPTGTTEGVYEFRLKVAGDNVPSQDLKVYASVTQSGQGNVLFKATDIYTATVGKDGKLIPGLANATITMQNEDVATVTQQLVTDSLGEALFQNLPAGRYQFKAKAANHQEIGGRLQIKPGITINQSVFLDYNLITVEWSVREITIQDRYEVTLNATYETDVPAAVVVIQPPSVNLPKMNAGDVYYGELSLINYGLVRADNVRQQLPVGDNMFRYEFLVEVPPTLEPKQRITIPYRVVALQSLEAQASSGTASGGGCYNYSNVTRVTCNYTCANGQTSSCGASTSWFAVSNSTCAVGSGGGGGGSGGGSWGGVGGGFGGGGASTPIKMTGQKCVYVPNGSGAQQCK